MMDEYNIRHPYLNEKLADGALELEINSENLFYSEIGVSHSGVQCNIADEKIVKEIHDKCRQVADLIREIDKLNKI